MPAEDLSVLRGVLGVPFRLGQAVESDPAIAVHNAQLVPERLPQVCEVGRAGADLSMLERSTATTKSAPSHLDRGACLEGPDFDPATDRVQCLASCMRPSVVM